MIDYESAQEPPDDQELEAELLFWGAFEGLLVRLYAGATGGTNRKQHFIINM